MRHYLSEINEETLTAVCSEDGPVQVRRRWQKGKVYFRCAVTKRAQDRRAARSRYERLKPLSPHREIMKDRLDLGLCERCGFKAEHIGQLDIDHIIRRRDGGTDDPENLWVLCANCHRLKTILERSGTWDFESFRRR